MLQMLVLCLQNSNLVLQADRGKRRGEDGAGEVESLWGKTKGMKMGDRIATTRPPELEAKLQKAKVLCNDQLVNNLDSGYACADCSRVILSCAACTV
jgi:hypothetical protein